MAEITNIGYVVDWADGANRGNGTDGTDVAEMALRMNALIYFDCLGHKEFRKLLIICFGSLPRAHFICYFFKLLMT